MWLLTLLFGSAYGHVFGSDDSSKGSSGDSLFKRLFTFDGILTSIFGGGGAPTPTPTPTPWTTDQIASWTTDFVQSLSTADIATLATDQIRAFTTDGVAALTGAQLQALTTSNVAAMTTDQIVALTTQQFANWGPVPISALTSDQVRVIETRDVEVLTTAQINSLSSGTFATLTTDQVVALTTAQVSALNTNLVAALTTVQVTAIETRDIAALTTLQVPVITTAAVQVLTTNQVIALTSAQMDALTSAQLSVLPVLPFSIPPLSTAQIAALTPAQIASLTTDQVVSFSTFQMPALSTGSIQIFSTSQIRAFETEDLVALTTTQIAALAFAQTAAMSTKQIEAFTSTQITAFTTAAYQGITTGTPLVLDLNGDGVSTLGINAGVKFDLFADGGAINTGWVSGTDGLLVLDRNRDGQINDGSELFGEATTLSNGQRATDGYAALRDMDANHDGVIDSQDAVYADLRVWVDANSDAQTGMTELKTLQELGISKINLNAAIGTDTNNGNLLGLTSSYETVDGAQHDMADVWFLADRTAVTASSTTLSPATVDSAIAALNTTDAQLVAESLPLNVAPDSAASGGSLMALEVPDATIATSTMTAPDMRSRVSDLAQAIGSFAAVDDLSANAPGASLTGGAGTTTLTTTPVALAVVSMVDVMKQFDSNGNQLMGSVSVATPSTKSLTIPGLNDPANNGILAAGGNV